jgi:SAM-dependent methyltransferase
MPTSLNRQGESMSSIASPPESIFPLLYQAQHHNYLEDLPFWLGLGEQQGSPILELGCGTGRVLIPLVEAGHTVVGLDIDPPMLSLCQRSIPKFLVSRVHLLLGDLTAFQLGTQFPLIILPCNTYSTLSRERRKAALTCIRAHLKTGGLFATSFPNPALMAALAPTRQPEVESHFTHPQSGNPVQISYEISRSRHTLNVVWHYDHLLPDGQVERYSHTIHHYLATGPQHLVEIEAAGFSILDTFGDFDRCAYQSNSPNLVIVARRT